jgi:hypothetical protein
VPFLFIGNNRYAERALELVSRRRLDAGWLHLAYPEQADLGAVLRLVVGLLLRPLAHLPDLRARDIRRLRLHTRRKHLTVALDGELHRLAQPLEFRIRRRFFQVLLPKSS